MYENSGAKIMTMNFLIDMLEEKKKNLEKAIQYLDAGCDDGKLIMRVGKEIEKLEKRIQGIKDICFIGKDGNYYEKSLVKGLIK